LSTAEYNVRVFTADIIYHLFDQFMAYMKEIKAQEQEAARLEAVFPCTLQVRLIGGILVRAVSNRSVMLFLFSLAPQTVLPTRVFNK
jgi:hypothetical protein